MIDEQWITRAMAWLADAGNAEWYDDETGMYRCQFCPAADEKAIWHDGHADDCLHRLAKLWEETRQYNRPQWTPRAVEVTSNG